MTTPTPPADKLREVADHIREMIEEGEFDKLSHDVFVEMMTLPVCLEQIAGEMT